MTVYADCLLCGGPLTRRTDTWQIGAFRIECDACKKDPEYSDISSFVLYYGKDEEIYEWSLEHPNGYYIGSVVKDFASQANSIWLQTTVGLGSKQYRHMGLAIPFKPDLDYIDRKIKTLLTFG